MTDLAAAPGTLPEGGEAAQQEAAWRMILRAFAENKLALAGLIMVVVIALFCFAGPLFWHTNQVSTNLLLVNKPPSAAHPLGTDDVGYDVLGLLMASWPELADSGPGGRGGGDHARRDLRGHLRLRRRHG